MTIPEAKTSEFRARYGEYLRTLDCVHCGLCITNCPTFELTGREADSPRGRIYLMRGFAEGEGELTPAVRQHLDQCIVCRACESVCPSGIRMGEMIEGFREELEARRTRRGLGYRLARFLLSRVLPYRARIAAISDLLWFYQWTRARSLVDLILPRLSTRLARLHRMQPTIPHPRDRRIAPTDSDGMYPAAGVRRMRVGLFLGCIASEWFADVASATIRVLQKNGCEVIVPRKQTCCGALHRHGGFLDEAEGLYARNADVFARAGVDVIVTNAAGCGAALKEPPSTSPDGLGAPVRDICEFLDEIGIVPPELPIVRRVAYDQPCHLQHGQRVEGSVVESLLGEIPGLELVPLVDSDRCCGSGGVYNLLQTRIADELRDDKAARVVESGAEILVTGNPGCAMQIRSGLVACGSSDIEVLHPVELLDRSYAW